MTSSNGRIILFIDEIHTVVGAGATGEGGMDAGAPVSRGHEALYVVHEILLRPLRLLAGDVRTSLCCA